MICTGDYQGTRGPVDPVVMSLLHRMVKDDLGWSSSFYLSDTSIHRRKTLHLDYRDLDPDSEF